MRGLFDYLDDCDIQSAPEYDYLGHFRAAEYLQAGHNELGLESQIEAGNIPDLGASGKNLPADAEAGNIAAQGEHSGQSEGIGKPAAMGQQAQAPKGKGLGKVLDMVTGGGDEDFSGGPEGETHTGGPGLGSSIKSLFDL